MMMMMTASVYIWKTAKLIVLKLYCQLLLNCCQIFNVFRCLFGSLFVIFCFVLTKLDTRQSNLRSV